MAEVSKPQLTAEQEKELQEQKYKFNRQVNYFVMRFMWQTICGHNAIDTIYQAFDTSRERYTRVVNTGKIRYGQGELEQLERLTGLRKELFTGEARFNCFYIEKQDNGEGKEYHITERNWQTLFTWREEQRNQSGEQKGKRSIKGTVQEKIGELLKRCETGKAKGNDDFYGLCYYLREREPAPAQAPEVTIREIFSVIEKLSFPLLDRCEVGQLQKLQKLIKDKSGLLGGMITYKNARNNFKKNK